MADPKAAPAPPVHWLRRPATVRKLWWTLYAVLAASVAVELFGIHHHAVFGIDGSFGFNAWYGFLACVAMVLGARLLGFAIKRRDDYYDAEADRGQRGREPR